MIAANEAVAGYFGWMKVPGIYRVHEAPAQEKLVAFAEFAAGFGHKIRLPLEPTSRFLADFIETLRGRPEERVLNEVLLRSMKQAVYAADNIGHFGLASAAYTHFTSPIRRYPDLVVHRLLRDLVRRGRFTPGARGGTRRRAAGDRGALFGARAHGDGGRARSGEPAQDRVPRAPGRRNGRRLHHRRDALRALRAAGRRAGGGARARQHARGRLLQAPGGPARAGRHQHRDARSATGMRSR